MENDNRSEFPLPKVIIQHIQSFLSGKQATVTSILSKSWYSAWVTRPNLNFNHYDFESSHEFWDITNKTMQRYEDLNLKIETFKLFIPYPGYYCPFLTKELMVRAMKLGATDLDIRFWDKWFVLPHEVIGSETLNRLYVSGCNIDLEGVTCSKLKSLYLSSVSLNIGDDIVNESLLFCPDLSSKFPCLKELAVCYSYYGFKHIRICSPTLERISFIAERGTVQTAEFDVPNIRKFQFEGSASCCLAFEPTCRDQWESDISIFSNQPNAAWFSSLNKLLRKLSHVSRVSLSIRFRFVSEKGCDYTRYVGGLSIPAVKNLKLLDDPVVLTRALTPTFIDGLFLKCRPNFIILYWFPKTQRMRKKNHDNYLLRLLCKRLVHRGSGICCITNPVMFGLHDLEEVNVEVFEARLGEWRSLPWKTLLDASAYPQYKRMVRFELKWGLD